MRGIDAFWVVHMHGSFHYSSSFAHRCSEEAGGAYVLALSPQELDPRHRGVVTILSTFVSKLVPSAPGPRRLPEVNGTYLSVTAGSLTHFTQL